ncbi:MAG: HAD family hydrolase [Clostridiales bacterium]|nr:HAD family hydrolase [Clostridiales bacterium]
MSLMNRGFDPKPLKGMVCLDLDGTLLNQDNTVTERNRRSLLGCLERGLQVYFVTGRPYCFTKGLAQSIDSRIGVIASAGSCYEKDGQLVQYEIEQEAVERMVELLAEQPTTHAFFKGLKSFYTHEPYDRRFLYDHMNAQFPEDLQVQSFTELSYVELKRMASHIHKILVYDMEKQRLDEFEKQVCAISSLSVSRYNDISIDVNAMGTDKGIAIKDIMNHLGLEKNQVLAIGDAPNDEAMFREAGIRIAMRNAKPEIKEMCQYVTGSNREDGVAQILEEPERYFQS